VNTADLVVVGAKLVERLPDGGALVCRVLELEDDHRQAVEEDHDIRPAVRTRGGPGVEAGDRELLDRQPVVGRWVFEIGQPDDGRSQV